MIIAVAALASVVTVAMSTAAACVPMPFVSIQPRASGPAGSAVTVAGASFPGPVELRWNGPDGTLLGSAEGPDFSKEVKVPAAPQGLYVVFAVARDPGGGVAGTASAAFQVTATAGAESDAQTAEVRDRGTASSARPRSGPGTEALILAGVGLLVLGGLAGVLAARFRRRADLSAELPEPKVAS